MFDREPVAARLQKTRVLAAGLLGCLLGACSGNIENVPGAYDDGRSVLPGASDGVGGGAGSGTVGPTSTTPPQTKGFSPAPSALRKLTVRQYQNSVTDLFGADAVVPGDLEPDTAVNGFYAIGSAKSTISPSAAEKFEAAAFALASKALDATHRDAFVGCTPAASKDSSCTTLFVSKFGARAFRRPLRAEELARYVALAEQAQTTLNSFHDGLQFAVAGLLQSPSFLFRAELGTPGATPDVSRPFDDYEMASRLSFLIWNSTPDQALLDAAARGELTVLAGLQTQAERLLADDRAKLALNDFHTERLSLDELDSLDIDKSIFSGLDNTLRTAMRDDVLKTISEFTFGAAPDFRSLFDTRVVFVNPVLATLYGLPAITAPARAVLPDSSPRVGLLGKVAILAGNGHANTTSPTKRGKFIRERLLCQSIPAPPPDVQTVLPAPDPSAFTMRERLRVHAQSTSCAGCHKLMDPIGLSLEHFDAVGRYRADDQGHALDTSCVLDGKPFDGAVALSSLLHDDPRTSECVARHLYRYAVAHVETSGEAPVIDALIEQFKDSNYRFTTLLRAVVASDGFRYGAGE